MDTQTLTTIPPDGKKYVVSSKKPEKRASGIPQIHMASMVSVQNKNKTKASASATAAIAIEGGLLTQTETGFAVSFAAQKGGDVMDIRRKNFETWAHDWGNTITDQHPSMAISGDGSVSPGPPADRALGTLTTLTPKAPAAPGTSDELAEGRDNTITQEQFQELVAPPEGEARTPVSADLQAELNLEEQINDLLGLPADSTMKAALLDIEDAIDSAAAAAPGADTTTPPPTAAAAPTAPPATPTPDPAAQDEKRRVTLTQLSQEAVDQVHERKDQAAADLLIGDWKKEAAATAVACVALKADLSTHETTRDTERLNH